MACFWAGMSIEPRTIGREGAQDASRPAPSLESRGQARADKNLHRNAVGVLLRTRSSSGSLRPSRTSREVEIGSQRVFIGSPKVSPLSNMAEAVSGRNRTGSIVAAPTPGVQGRRRGKSPASDSRSPGDQGAPIGRGSGARSRWSWSRSRAASSYSSSATASSSCCSSRSTGPIGRSLLDLAAPARAGSPAPGTRPRAPPGRTRGGRRGSPRSPRRSAPGPRGGRSPSRAWRRQGAGVHHRDVGPVLVELELVALAGRHAGPRRRTAGGSARCRGRPGRSAGGGTRRGSGGNTGPPRASGPRRPASRGRSRPPVGLAAPGLVVVQERLVARPGAGRRAGPRAPSGAGPGRSASGSCRGRRPRRRSGPELVGVVVPAGQDGRDVLAQETSLLRSGSPRSRPLLSSVYGRDEAARQWQRRRASRRARRSARDRAASRSEAIRAGEAVASADRLRARCRRGSSAPAPWCSARRPGRSSAPRRRRGWRRRPG